MQSDILDKTIEKDNYQLWSFVVHEYLDETRKSAFRAWLGTLDKGTRARVQARILRFETGNLGDHKDLGSAVWEARLAFGSGYRVYFGRRGRELILLLLGGDKGSQARDIRRAKGFKHGKT